jgi:CO dehydrogenase maturation factor
VDNEAGLEHISRGTLPHMDILLLVSDCSRRGIQAVGRVKIMAEELKLAPKTMKLIVNRAPGGVLDEGILEEIKIQQLELVGVLPQDETVYRYDCDGKPTSKVPDDNPVKLALRQIMDTLEL